MAEMKFNLSQLVSFEFQVFGRVQGRVANKQKIVGWVQNTNQNTVIGVSQGTFDDSAMLVYWLSKIGSPQSKIDKLELKNCRIIDKLEFHEFNVIRTNSDVKELTEPDSPQSKEIENELREYGRLKFESET